MEGKPCIRLPGVLEQGGLRTRLPSRLQFGPGRIAPVALMLCLWLGLVVLANSQTLHHCLHEDSSQPNHECVVGLVGAGGAVALSAGADVLCVVPGFVFQPVRCGDSCHIEADVQLPAGRGPPSGSLLR